MENTLSQLVIATSPLVAGYCQPFNVKIGCHGVSFRPDLNDTNLVTFSGNTVSNTHFTTEHPILFKSSGSFSVKTTSFFLVG